jgi:ATP-dependent Zn protease
MVGRAAEELIFGTIGSGGGGQAKSDLAIATRIAAAMELRLAVGELWLPHMDVDLPAAAGVSGLLPAVRRHLDDAMDRACAVLIEHRGFLDRLSAELYRTGVLLDDDIQTIATACRATVRLN